MFTMEWITPITIQQLFSTATPKLALFSVGITPMLLVAVCLARRTRGTRLVCLVCTERCTSKSIFRVIWTSSLGRSLGLLEYDGVIVREEGEWSVTCPGRLLFCLKKNLNAPRPSEHPPVRGKKCQNVWVGSIAENTKPLHGI